MSRGFFITGTDTGVGKTWTALSLLHDLNQRGLSTAAMKPVATGCKLTAQGLRNSDAERLMAGASVKLPYSQVNPYPFAPSIAPHIAAAESETPIRVEKIEEIYRSISTSADFVIIEGIGGWKVPLNDQVTMADLVRVLGLPVVLVVGLRLGCLNHALLSSASIISDGANLAGWVANTLNPAMDKLAENIATLTQLIPAPLLGTIPYLPQRSQTG